MDNNERDLLANEVAYYERRSKDLAECMGLAHYYRHLLAGVDLSDVDTVSISSGWDEIKGSISLTLKECRSKESKLAHELAKRFGVTFKKQKNYSGDAITMQASVNGYQIYIYGYVGQCKVVQTEEQLTDEEYGAAVAQVKRTRVKTQIVCKPEEEADLDYTGQEDEG